MESLFEVLFQYAAENCCPLLSPEDREEQVQCRIMIRHAMKELIAKGYGELAQRIEDGWKSLAWLDQRSLFRAGLSMGLALNRL